MKHPKHYDTDEATSKRMANVKLKKGTAEILLQRNYGIKVLDID